MPDDVARQSFGKSDVARRGTTNSAIRSDIRPFLMTETEILISKHQKICFFLFLLQKVHSLCTETVKFKIKC